MKHANVYRIAGEFILLCICIFLFISTLSFDINDSPSDYVWPHDNPPHNLCGRAGAFAAYYALYYFGPGILVAWFSAAAALAIHIFGKPVTQPILRLVGLILVVASISTAWHMVWPYETLGLFKSGSFPTGNGGILGVGAAVYLHQHLAKLGAWLVVLCCWTVGALLLADSVVFAIVRWFGTVVLKAMGLAEPAWNAACEHSQALGEIWVRLSQRQKKQAASFAQAVQNYAAQHKAKSSEQLPAAQEPVQSVPEEAEPVLSQPDAQGMPDTQNAPVKQAQTDESEQPEEKIKTVMQKSKQASRPKAALPVQRSYDDYQLPPLELLREPETGFAAVQSKMVEHKAKALEDLLEEFGISANVVNAEAGPAITMYELELAPGVKVNQISALSNDMARALGSGSVRVVAPLAGKHTIGIEVPNSQREIVRLKELIQKGTAAAKMQIPLFLGKSSSGEVLVSDLASMPHLLIAGTTGSGKSVCINSIITSILLTRRPDEVKLILIDPKMVEMAMFESIPHLMCPTITEMRRAEQILEWAMQKMDERYELLAEAQVRNIASYNLLTAEQLIERFKPSSQEEEAKIPKKLPHIVIIIDELADLMMTSAKEVEAYIVRIAQKSRAVGIHLVLATQRPQATVVTGLIKSNMPSRIAFRVAARMDSRIILDQNGAEALLGQGDMLFLRPGTSELVRSQGAYLEDDEIRGIVDFLKNVAQPQYSTELMQLNTIDLSAAKQDELFEDAVKVVLETQRGSVSLLQRRLGIGYARASRIIETMAAMGLLGEYKGSQAREVVMTLEEYEAMRKNMIHDQVAGYSDLTQEAADSDEIKESRPDDDFGQEEHVLTPQEEDVDTR